MENLGFGLWVSGFKNSSLLETFFWFFYQFGDCVTVQEKELGHGKSDFWISLGPAPHAHTHTTPEYSGKGQGKEDLQVCKEWEIKEREQSGVLSSFPSFFLDVSSVEPFSPLDTWSC